MDCGKVDFRFCGAERGLGTVAISIFLPLGSKDSAESLTIGRIDGK